MSSKFSKLKEVLTAELRKQIAGDRTLIFVKTRWTAKTLCTLLRDFLAKYGIDRRCEYVVGHGGRASSVNNSSTLGGGEILTPPPGMNPKEQQQIVESFRTGNVDLLVATSVLEEGIDVGKCRLVIRYDDAPTATSLQQSRGRARGGGGETILLTDKPRAIEDFLIKEQQMAGAVAIARDELIAIRKDGSGGARRFLEEDGKDILQAFCTSKGADEPPKYIVEKAEGLVIKAKHRYVATVVLPQGCDHQREWKCDASIDSRTTREMAQNIAAYKVCIDLHRKGLLDNIPPGLHYLKKIRKDRGGGGGESPPPSSSSSGSGSTTTPTQRAASEMGPSPNSSGGSPSRHSPPSVDHVSDTRRTEILGKFHSIMARPGDVGTKLNELNQSLGLDFKPDHLANDGKFFRFVITYCGTQVGEPSRGLSKKEAKRSAMISALDTLEQNPDLLISLFLMAQ